MNYKELAEISDKDKEISQLASLLPSEQNDEFTRQASVQVSRDAPKEEILRNLNQILREIRNLIPDYETLDAGDFASENEIDVVTVGETQILFDAEQGINIPSGTRIRKSKGSQQFRYISIKMDNGVFVQFSVKNYPKTGIRIQPRKQEAE